MNTNLTITRYPSTQNRSLKAWNASDELIVSHLQKNKLSPKKTVIYNDRFGYLGCYLASFNPTKIIHYKSEEKAFKLNADQNKISLDTIEIQHPLQDLPTDIELGIIKVPKSIELFDFYLSSLVKNLKKDATVLCGFMTKYFNKSMLEVANTYFEEVEQSLALKKSRILILKSPKNVPNTDPLISLKFNHTITGELEIKQYPGVFSSKNIDYATQFFLDHLGVLDTDERILDLASGNGIIARTAITIQPNAEFHLVDDSYLAIESSKLNMPDGITQFFWNDGLDLLEKEYFDLVLSNPPFHFGFETNVEVSIHLFKQVHQCLKIGGRFRAVTSKHLNFKTHLEPLFSSTKIIAETTKFVVYESVK